MTEAKKGLYDSLEGVLEEALAQASGGKGHERHADGQPFDNQPILRITRDVGIGFPSGQAIKKTVEAVGCYGTVPDRAIADLLGAINYLAATILFIREQRKS